MRGSQRRFTGDYDEWSAFLQRDVCRSAEQIVGCPLRYCSRGCHAARRYHHPRRWKRAAGDWGREVANWVIGEAFIVCPAFECVAERLVCLLTPYHTGGGGGRGDDSAIGRQKALDRCAGENAAACAGYSYDDGMGVVRRSHHDFILSRAAPARYWSTGIWSGVRT